MTYIEFFDKNIIDNICTSIVSPPDRVILIGDNIKQLKMQTERYASFFKYRGYSIEFECKSVSRSKIGDVIDVLSDVINTYDDCVFDITGGDETYLVALGIIFEKFKDKNIQMHRFNIRNNTIHDCDLDGKCITEKVMPEITVDENISLYGGAIVYEDDRKASTPEWHIDNEFVRDVEAMWEVCKKDPKAWNSQIGVFMKADSLDEDTDNVLYTTVSASKLNQALKQMNIKDSFDTEIIKGLTDKGIIKVTRGVGIINIAYKNEQVKMCLNKAGQVLEMRIYVGAIRTLGKNNAPVYNDVMNGVCIDWDGEINSTDKSDIENEIDVVMMHGMVPVFVSCKNGAVTVDELYKLNTVASRFGGSYAKKALIVTSLEKDSAYEKTMTCRAEEMGIRIVKNLCSLSSEETDRVIGTLWN